MEGGTSHPAQPGTGEFPPGLFPATRWTLVTEAGGGSLHAIEWLCRQYWQPIRNYLRRFRLPHEDAEDLTQSFLVHLMNRARLARPDRARGSFRCYLQGALRHYVIDHLRRAQRTATVPLDSSPAGRQSSTPAPELPPDVEYERNFVLALLNHAFDQVQADYARRGQAQRFEVLRGFLPGRDPDCSQAQAAVLLGISEGAVGKALSDLRERFRQTYRRLVAQTVHSPTEVDSEIRHHLAVLAAGPPQRPP